MRNRVVKQVAVADPLRLRLLAACVAGLLCLAPAQSSAQAVAPPQADPGPAAGLDLLRLAPELSYRNWREQRGWVDRRPFSDSARRFRIEDGALRLESAGDSYLIGRALAPHERRAISEWPFLRFVVRIAAVPQGARLEDEERDDAAFRIFAVFHEEPLRALVYVWSWELPVGAWSARGRSPWGDFRQVHRKAFGRGEPQPQDWLTVEVDLRADFQARFPGRPLPVLEGIGLKADSNDVPDGRSLAWLRAASLHRTSLGAEGHREGDRLGDTLLWFR